MPSIKPKIQGYVEPELFSAFEQWRIEQGKGISEALNDLLKEFFKFERLSYKEGLNKEEIEKLIEEKLFAINRRIESLEEIVEPIIGLAEISHPLPGESKGDTRESPVPSLGLITIEGRCPSCYADDMSAIPYLEDNEVFFQCLNCGWEKLYPLSEAKEAGYIPYQAEESKGDIWESPLEEPEEESKPSSLEQEVEANPLPEISPESPTYSAANYPRKGDRFSTSHGKEGEIIKIWAENPKYEIQWDGLALPKRHDLSDLQVMGARPIPSLIPLEGLKQAELERRLKISKGILTKRRGRPDFKEWSQSHDPQGIAWRWDAIARKYLAVE